jgi:hypothetical protein
MNLHQIASGAIGIVNPFQQIQIRRATNGYTTNPDGSRTPAYELLSGPAQLQDLSSDDLRLLADAGFNIQANRRTVYLNGHWAGIVRADQTGGDIFLIGGYEWLATMVAEQWPDWARVIVTLQSPKTTTPFVTPPPSPVASKV